MSGAVERESVIIGGGPAGLAAAIVIAKAGGKVLVIDENKRPGGQLFKQIHKFFGSKAHNAGIRGVDIGRQLLNDTRECGVEVWLDAAAVGIFPDKQIAVLKDGGTIQVSAKKILISTGASENAICFPGWTLPGVMGAGAAQTMINVNRVLPGKRVLMIGSGNVGVIVAYQLLQAGAEVAAIVEALPAIGAYGVHASKLRRAGVPLYLNHTIIRAEGGGRVESTVIAGLDDKGKPVNGTEKKIDVDVVCIAAGLRPLTEIAWMSGVKHDYVPELGGFMPLHNDDMETDIPGIYVAGDSAGVEEANTAMDEGRLAGAAMAASLGYIAGEKAEEMKTEIRSRLLALRQGPFGEKRLAAKTRILNNNNGQPLSSIPHSSSSFLIKNGFPSPEEIKSANTWPTEERFSKGPVALIECVQEIPCNPCEDACPFHSIHIGNPITNLPKLDPEKCTGCGLCIAACSGLAIFVVNKAYSETEATVSFPFEYLPLPEKGSEVQAVNRAGEYVCMGTVDKIMNPAKNDHTPVVTIIIPKEHADTVRSIRRLNAPPVCAAEPAAGAATGGLLPDDVLVCRCEEISAGEIRRAIREYGADSVTGVKRRVRAGMGLCQGRTCGKLVARILAEETGQKLKDILPATDRPPVRPVTFGELGGPDE